MLPESVEELRRYFVLDDNHLNNSINSVSIRDIDNLLLNPNISEGTKILFRRLIQLKLQLLNQISTPLG